VLVLVLVLVEVRPEVDVLGLLLALHHTLDGLRRGATSNRVLIEKPLGTLAAYDRIRHLVGVPLVRVAGFADAALQLHAAALLRDVRGLVGCCVEARRARECDVGTGRVGLGADRAARGRGVPTHVRLDARDVVAAEQGLDSVAVRQ